MAKFAWDTAYWKLDRVHLVILLPGAGNSSLGGFDLQEDVPKGEKVMTRAQAKKVKGGS